MPTQGDYLICLGFLPSWVQYLPEPWKLIKDELRGTVQLDPEPRVWTSGCLAFLKFRDEDQAFALTQLLDGYAWPIEERKGHDYVWGAGETVLKAWLLSQSSDNEVSQIYGPRNLLTGSIIQVPVPRSPSQVHRQRRPQRVFPTTIHGRGASSQPVSLVHKTPENGQTLQQQQQLGLASIPNQPREPPTNPNASNGRGHHHRHSPRHSSTSHNITSAHPSSEFGQLSLAFSTTGHLPRGSGSSHRSVTSQSPLTPVSTTPSRASSIYVTPPGSVNGSLSSSSISSSTPRDNLQPSRPDDHFTSRDVEPRTLRSKSFKVSIGNLKPRTTRQEVNDLLEQHIEKYLQYKDMRLIESKGQVYAEMIFKEMNIADQVVQKLNAFRLKGRILQVQSFGIYKVERQD